ncbi:MAG: 30S ribosomal protein S4 [Candidatus Nealsonbacteria bacterium RBG_13_37_56]|uniref:Small ribosomal subunit protein uS4 n=1 Tax=Candidatus Nealsonbacteria bacterium RBG_13_37_56 TaxID=1801661 RepID=A0A1G2DVS9_9BACT|nr:MAG: 30S ribosomal protein S4 [Candidatus Nealsonbacteria bacterium RBG_13_37_56]
MKNNRCKICRRLGVKLFFKGDRCLSAKCAMVKRPYPPGEKAKKRRGSLSEYGKELKEKQKLKNWYNLSERQFSRYVMEVLNKRTKTEDAGALLIKKLENRLDNVVFQTGFAVSRIQARQLVSHGYFLINGRKINIPSYQIKKGDKISLHPKTSKKAIFNNIVSLLKKRKAPSWIKVNHEKLEVEIVGQANLEETTPPAEISSIFEFYSK